MVTWIVGFKRTGISIWANLACQAGTQTYNSLQSGKTLLSRYEMPIMALPSINDAPTKLFLALRHLWGGFVGVVSVIGNAMEDLEEQDTSEKTRRTDKGACIICNLFIASDCMLSLQQS